LRQLSKSTSQAILTTHSDDAWWGDDGGHPDALPHHLGNVVFMGMGEPFANYDRWWHAVERLHDPQGMNIGARGLTVSTVGLVPGIKRLTEAPLPINLAISLHAPNDALRSAMMPVNKRWNITELIDTTREYVQKTGRRVSFEYVLLQGENDTPELAGELADLLQGMLCHVNLIPWNPVPGMPLGRSERQRVIAFQRILHDAGVPCTVRVERGVSIAAACGQLAGAPISGP
jgi:23S rRNA (adenine2503-C2)-methyltransferase